MAVWSRTSREADGESVVGAWRHAFINNGGTYYLTDLVVYADGIVDCWGLVTLDEFRDKISSGWVATTLRDGAHASAHELASWTFTDVKSQISPEALYDEVVDQVDELNDRPDSSGRCLEALESFVADPTQERQDRLAGAYDAVPLHRRMYLLGDQDAKDWPLRVLITPLGAELGGRVVTAERREQAFAYFAGRAAHRTRAQEQSPPTPAAVVVPGTFHHRGWPEPAGLVALHVQYPAPVRLGGATYPTVEHAYWALRTTDASVRTAVMAETNPYGLSQLGREAPARPGWDAALQATILQLLRAKFQQHDDLARELLATGDGRIDYQATGFASAYEYQSRRHVIGRLLEVVRSEQRAWRSGLLDLSVLD